MEYRKLGKSDIEISRIGFGCMSLKKDNPESINILQKAFEQGITYFDTADIYEEGFNETLLGKAFQGKRGQIIIATKVGNVPGTNTGKGWEWNASKAYILKAVEQSLKRLQTDYIDLYQLHGGTLNDSIDETVEAFEILKQQGKIKAYGISSIRPNVISEYVKRSQPASNMMQYSLLDRRPEETVLPLLQKEEISILVRGSIAQGIPATKPAKPYLGYTTAEVAAMAGKVKQLSIPGRNTAQTAMRYVLQNPAVASVVAGIRTFEQLEEAVQSLNAPSLSLEEIAALQATLPANFYTEHRD